ncbi:sesquipedalian-1 isoform X2 [Anopheles aquasalis]|uniref:sesquipedalian-1 isoform X2 n=1 Tax=Anopheles aquasalis TaxID=42839 RepID=UPI00215A2F0E|nr:sesquipedalian-1 isoform X2 [Anopheles aquasalis]
MKINEKSLCLFATTPPVDLEGWMNKRGELNKSWQRRWFVLKGNLLFYFEKRGDKEPLGMIILEGCTVELAEEGEQYCFQIIFHGPNNRTYYLSTESQPVMEQWMKALTCAGYDYMKLMVAELQRQLEEIEEQCKEKQLDVAAVLSSSKEPPPRRQNPFNKSCITEPHSVSETTAPPLSSSATQSTAPWDDEKRTVVSSDAMEPRAKPRNRSLADSNELNMTAPKSNGGSVDRTDGINYVAAPDSKEALNGASCYSFEAMHSTLGIPVLADLSKWNESVLQASPSTMTTMTTPAAISVASTIF